MKKEELVEHIQAELAEVLKGPSTPNYSVEKFLKSKAEELYAMLAGFDVLKKPEE